MLTLRIYISQSVSQSVSHVDPHTDSPPVEMVLSFITIKTNNKEMVRGLLKISAINWKILFLNNRKK